MDYKIYVHDKTGSLYAVTFTGAIECTNGREDKLYVIYSKLKKLGDAFKVDTSLVFVREVEEFHKKFTYLGIKA